jgi:hypothetical protein
MAAPVLTFWERAPPLAAVAAAKLGDVDIAVQPEVKGTKDTPAVLAFATG